MNEPRFTSGFPALDKTHWRKLVDQVLKGAPFEKLVGRTYDGLDIAPLHDRASHATPLASAHSGPWEQLARVDNPDPRAANEQALTDLENGATGLHLIFAGATGAYGFGLSPDLETLDHALDSVILEAGVTLEIDAGVAGTQVAAHLEAILAARKVSPADVRIAFGLDPLHEDASLCAQTALALHRAGFTAPMIVADARRVHMAGGTEAQELALALATGLAALRALEQAGLSLDEARRLLTFRLAADADQLLTLAKMRALRVLWAQVESACGLQPRPIRLHAESAWRMITRLDPYVNLLRTTVAAFSAGVGGADLVTVLPFTQALGLPDAFARRLARNTQLILSAESHLGHVADPAAGAGSIETLTQDLSLSAWALFQTSEQAGGLAPFLATLSQAVATTRKMRLDNVARRKDALTGTSEFANLHEAPVDVLAQLPTLRADPLFPAMRLSQDFEALRARADAANVRPRIYLATLGTSADFTARAMFAKNAYEAGGMDVILQDGDDPIGGFIQSGARLACICSSDALYAEKAAELAVALKTQGATVFLAGRPGAIEESLRAAGISHFLFAGANLIDHLANALELA